MTKEYHWCYSLGGDIGWKHTRVIYKGLKNDFRFVIHVIVLSTTDSALVPGKCQYTKDKYFCVPRRGLDVFHEPYIYTPWVVAMVTINNFGLGIYIYSN